MRFRKPSNQSHKNGVQRAVRNGAIVLAPISGRADEFDDQKNHLQRLMDQANTVKDNLASDLLDALFKGDALFVIPRG
jgi:hypothetical protein